jgi:phage baseplate assembly protein W
MARFKGFSTINRYKKFTLTDNELIKRDLLNALTIREGELPGRPSFGTRLWNFIFEPNTPDIVRQITAELERTVTYDPRIRIEDVIVTTDPEGVILELVVAFVPDLNPEVLQIKFDEESQTAQYL